MAGTAAKQQVGWLLRTNRRLGHDESLRSGREFARVFRCDGDQPLAPSQITRWENGSLPASHITIRRYEHLLGLPAESLVTVSDALMRVAFAGTTGRPDTQPVSDQDRDRLHELLDRASADTAGGSMRGADWGRLTELIRARPDLELHPPDIWRRITDRLLTELVASRGIAWFQRQEAMSRLLEHPAAARHAVAACIALAADPSSPAVIEPLSLLDVSSHPDANRTVLREIEHPGDDRTMHGALLAAIRKINHRHFRNDEWPRLARSMSVLMTEAAVNETLLPLIVNVGRALERRLPDADSLRRSVPRTFLAQHIWAAERTSEPASTQAMSRHIAAAAQRHLPSDGAKFDEVLVTLIEESLFVPDPNRRLVAGALIAATPYREPVARALLEQITKDLARRSGTEAAATALHTLTNLNVDLHRPLIHDILLTPGFSTAVRHAAAWATPFCAGRTSLQTWRAIATMQIGAWRRDQSSLCEGVLQGVVYGIGTDRHHQLLAEIRDSADLPVAARTTASSQIHTADPTAD